MDSIGSYCTLTSSNRLCIVLVPSFWRWSAIGCRLAWEELWGIFPWPLTYHESCPLDRWVLDRFNYVDTDRLVNLRCVLLFGHRVSSWSPTESWNADFLLPLCSLWVIGWEDQLYSLLIETLELKLPGMMRISCAAVDVLLVDSTRYGYRSRLGKVVSYWLIPLIMSLLLLDGDSLCIRFVSCPHRHLTL